VSNESTFIGAFAVARVLRGGVTVLARMDANGDRPAQSAVGFTTNIHACVTVGGPPGKPTEFAGLASDRVVSIAQSNAEPDRRQQLGMRSAMSQISKALCVSGVGAALAVALGGTVALADPLGFAAPSNPFGSVFEQILRGPSDDNNLFGGRPNVQRQEAARPSQADTTEPVELPAHLRRQVVEYPTREAAGTIVIDTPHTYLYYVLGGGRALRYGIGVGREGFTWSGVQTIARKAEWPDWNPPPEMIARQPYLPRFMAGGPSNPLGARAMYLGNTIYRIHGTNAPQTIGTRVSSGCIRLVNADVIDLYSRVNIGTKVVVLPMSGRSADRIVQSQAGGPTPRVN